MVEIKLHYPFEYDQERIEVINLKRPKGKHLKGLPDKPTVEDILILAAKLSGKPTTVFDEMDAVDVVRVAEEIEGFLLGGQKSGER